jgi:hypothetical protein
LNPDPYLAPHQQSGGAKTRSLLDPCIVLSNPVDLSGLRSL